MVVNDVSPIAIFPEDAIVPAVKLVNVDSTVGLLVEYTMSFVKLRFLVIVVLSKSPISSLPVNEKVRSPPSFLLSVSSTNPLKTVSCNVYPPER